MFGLQGTYVGPYFPVSLLPRGKLPQRKNAKKDAKPTGKLQVGAIYGLS